MKIAILAPSLFPLRADIKYGGIERIIISLIRGLSADHKITIYAPYGSSLPDKRVRFLAYSKPGETVSTREKRLFKMIIKDQYKYDIINSFMEPIIAREGNKNPLKLLRKPAIFSFHNLTRIPENLKYYRQNTWLWRHYFTFVSHDQALPLSFLPRKAMIYNGINLNELTFSDEPKLQLNFLGRIMHDKGTLEAIQLAKALHLRLEIGAKIDDLSYDYYDDKIRTHIDGKQIVYLGEIDAVERDRMLGDSLATVCLINWHEPFGLAVIESMAAGTPVIGRSMGSLPELIQDGKSGILIPADCSIDQCVKIVLEKLPHINRLDCRLRAEEFSEIRMVKKYLKLYQMVNAVQSEKLNLELKEKPI